MIKIPAELLPKINKIYALYVATSSDGERSSALSALERLAQSIDIDVMDLVKHLESISEKQDYFTFDIEGGLNGFNGQLLKGCICKVLQTNTFWYIRGNGRKRKFRMTATQYKEVLRIYDLVVNQFWREVEATHLAVKQRNNLYGPPRDSARNHQWSPEELEKFRRAQDIAKNMNSVVNPAISYMEA